jgi:hypothetical protein
MEWRRLEELRQLRAAEVKHFAGFVGIAHPIAYFVWEMLPGSFHHFGVSHTTLRCVSHQHVAYGDLHLSIPGHPSVAHVEH